MKYTLFAILVLTLNKGLMSAQPAVYTKIENIEIVRHPNSLRFYHKGYPIALIHFEQYDKQTKETAEKEYDVQLPEQKNNAVFVHNLFIEPHARKLGLIKFIFSSAALELLNDNIREIYWIAQPYENKVSETRKLKANFKDRLKHLINIYQTFGAQILFQNNQFAVFKFSLLNVNKNLLNAIKIKIASKL